jgi:hypothetical protein
MNITSFWQNNKQIVVLSVTAVVLLIISFMLDIVKIGLIIAGLSILVFVVISVVKKVRSQRNKEQ